MTNFEVEIISRETIKPSSPTPPHLRNFQISLIDQTSPIVYPPLILYYSLPKTEDPSAKLRNSLSEALTRFYPLAGRIKENRFVDCNDDGVLFLMAKVNCSLSEFLKQPQFEVLENFLPLKVICTEPTEVALQLAIQINKFSDGGISVGVSATHKILDGIGISAFLKYWAAIARGTFAHKDERVDCVAASLFPPRETLPTNTAAAAGDSFADKVKSRTTRFVFDAEAISNLKDKAKSEAVPNPTSTEALFGFIWKCVANASTLATGSQKPSVLANAINLRQKMEPQLPDYTIGNIVWKVFSRYEPGKTELDLKDLVGIVRNSIAEIDSKYVQKLIGDEGSERISKWLDKVAKIYSNGNRVYEITSMRSMGLDEMDFGWGKPIWASLVELRECKNLIILIESRRGEGVDVWMALDEHEMSKLENDPEVLAFASVNPGISCVIHEKKI